MQQSDRPAIRVFFIHAAELFPCNQSYRMLLLNCNDTKGVMNMKRMAAILLAAALLLCSGCGLWNEPTDEPLIHVFSNDETVAPYERFVSGTSWTSNGWVSASNFYFLIGELEELSKSFPTITYSDDFEIRCANNVTAQDIHVYDAELESINTNANGRFLSTLTPGTYYILIRVWVQGKYIAAGKDYASSGYDCCYKLIIP